MADSELKIRINEDMKAAMRAKEKERLGTIRLILAAIKQREVDERIELDDTQVLAVLDKMVKQRRDSIEQYMNAGREELADKERFELDLIQGYMPAALSEAELDAIIKEVVVALGASSMQDMGKVMAELKPKIQGRADMGQVSQKVKAAMSA
ncbi:MAG: glutamyl-tRNA amidotransferase [Gammaproteobacteria bacterium SG8_15]|nr:MAG: glutamyl-tRNA amidotransferase [Gammaproteobacteria bacterium SG8_15]